jgi:hypothetical protein
MTGPVLAVLLLFQTDTTQRPPAYVTGVGDIVLTGRRVDDVIATMYQASIGFAFR